MLSDVVFAVVDVVVVAELVVVVVVVEATVLVVVGGCISTGSLNHSFVIIVSIVGRFVHSYVNIDLTRALTAGDTLLLRTQ